MEITIYISLIVLLIYCFVVNNDINRITLKSIMTLKKEKNEKPLLYKELIAGLKIQIDSFGRQQEKAYTGYIISLALTFILVFSIIGWVTFFNPIEVENWIKIIPIIGSLTLSGGFKFLYNESSKKYNESFAKLQSIALDQKKVC